MHLDSSWIRTGTTIAVILVGLVSSFIMQKSSVESNSRSIVVLTERYRIMESKVNTLNVDVAVTKVIVSRMDRKLDLILQAQRRTHEGR